MNQCSCNKIRYRDKHGAKHAISTMRGRVGKLRPYRCAGGFWHIGHTPAALVEGRVSRAQLIAHPPAHTGNRVRRDP